jgi:NADH:ubiquinone oxidoreductase subunit 6 (subunit J)
VGTLRPRQAWGLGVLAAGAALVAVVAVTAEGAPLRAPTDDGRAGLPERLLAGLEVAVLVAGALLVVAMVVMAITSGSRRAVTYRGRRSLWRTVLVVAALALVSGALLARQRNDHESDENGRGSVATTVAVEGSTEATRPTWPLAVLGTVVVVALAAAGWAARRRRPTFDAEVNPRAADEVRRAAGSAFSASLADLEAEPDPRRAIVAAYGRLLDGLDAAGFGRQPAEAPEEHLRRVLEQLQVPPAPLHTLVALFAEARFSEHALTAAHKQSAIDAFRAARDALAGLAPAGDAG